MNKKSHSSVQDVKERGGVLLNSIFTILGVIQKKKKNTYRNIHWYTALKDLSLDSSIFC
jgi:hypothetical protein